MTKHKIFTYLFILYALLICGQSYAAVSVTQETVNSLFSGGGTFDNGSTGWYADNSGGGQIISYGSPTGWVGLRCAAGQTIKFQNYIPNSTLWNIPDLDGHVRDQIKVSVRIRGAPTVSASTIAGFFWMTLQGALALDTYSSWSSNLDTTTLAAAILCPDSTNIYWGRMTTWTWLNMFFTPPHADWWQIRNIQFMYTASSGAPATTEIQIDQIQMILYRFYGTYP